MGGTDGQMNITHKPSFLGKPEEISISYRKILNKRKVSISKKTKLPAVT